MALPYQAAVSGNTIKNKGGTVLKAGNIASNSPITQNFTLLESTSNPITYGSKVSLSSGSTGSSGNVGSFTPLSGLGFAYKQVAHQFHGVKMTQDVAGLHAGVTPQVFGPASASSENMRSIPYLESTRTFGSGVTASMNYVTGHFTKGGNAGGTTGFGQDHAARPTNGVPGELTYKTGALNPVQNDYKPKVAP